MALINWSDDLSVKISGIDNQHKKLVELINDLHNAMKEGKGKEKLGAILNELINYTKYHFSAEEELMKQKNYPGYQQHKSEHDAFTKKVLEFNDQFVSGSLFMSNEVLVFLKDWLIEHIKGTDKKYSPYLTAK